MKHLKLTIVFFLTAMLSFAEVSNSEKEALVALYNSTNGASWNTTWDLEAPINTWHGVTVQDSKVVGLNLSFNNLKGQLPTEIGNLIHLKSINLGFNKINGTLPESISKLKDYKLFNPF